MLCDTWIHFGLVCMQANEAGHQEDSSASSDEGSPTMSPATLSPKLSFSAAQSDFSRLASRLGPSPRSQQVGTGTLAVLIIHTRLLVQQDVCAPRALQDA